MKVAGEGEEEIEETEKKGLFFSPSFCPKMGKKESVLLFFSLSVTAFSVSLFCRTERE